ncbi:MAG TPA: enoyl-CoA hydratase-related protein [Burkholderiales bacterium]|nr:enoyl-CoA hydratase-related protein [Burkholderiales bacterium]
MRATSPSSNLILTRIEPRADGRVATVTVNNPEKRNALGLIGKQELAGTFRRLARDKSLRVAVLTGAGDRSFIAGADIAEMKDLTPREAHEVHAWVHRACDAIRALPVPVIARVNGYCFGAGMEIAASCDMRIGVTTAKFGMPEVRFGIPSGMEACLLPQLIGWGRTRELVFTGDHIDAAAAYRCGFLEKLVEPAGLDAGVEQWVSSILAAGPRAIRLQKALVRDWERMTFKQAVQAGIRACTEARRTDEPKRLMAAFLARRKK